MTNSPIESPGESPAESPTESNMANNQTITNILTICNYALLALGHTGLSHWHQSDLAACLCRQFYPLTRDALLTRYPWSFATVLNLKLAPKLLPDIRLSQLYPNYQQYDLPEHILQLLPNHPTTNHPTTRNYGGDLIINHILLSRHNPAYISAIRRPLADHFPPFFQQLLAVALAAELALPLTEDLTRAQVFKNQTTELFLQAKKNDQAERPTLTVTGKFPLLAVR